MLISIFGLRLPPSVGGMERQTYLQAIELQKHINITVFSVSADPSSLHKIKNCRCLTEYNGAASKEINALRITFLALFTHFFWKSEIIYIHQFNILSWLIIMICRLRNVKIYCKIANTGPKFDLNVFYKRYGFLRFVARKILLNEKLYFLILSPDTKNELNAYGVRDSQIIQFRNGVKIKSSKSDIKSRKNRVLFAGRLEPVKRVDLILSLACVLKEVQFDIFGEGSLRKKLIRNKRLGNLCNVSVLGELLTDDIPYSEYEWLILPSEAEGMSNVVLEALSFSLGLILRDIPANQFARQLTGKLILFEKDDVESIAKNFRNCSALSKPYSEFSKYDIEMVSHDLIELWRENAH